MHTFKKPTIDKIKEKYRSSGTNHFSLFDTPAEMALFGKAKISNRDYMQRSHHRWNLGQLLSETIETTIKGDMSAVEASDQLLAQMEQHDLGTSRRAWINDVAGSMPDVQAFIAGHPLAMRRRIRDASAFAPIAIVVDLSTSAAINAKDVQNRGIAILALVRALAARRPIELWTLCGLDAGSGRNAAWVGCRIETSPLDLSSAAYMLSHPGVPRNLIYGLAEELHDFGGSWPYNAGALEASLMAEILAPAFPHVTEVLAVPGLHLTDESVTNPTKWIADQIAKTGVQNFQEAA